jgi:hypothetical protein
MSESGSLDNAIRGDGTLGIVAFPGDAGRVHLGSGGRSRIRFGRCRGWPADRRGFSNAEIEALSGRKAIKSHPKPQRRKKYTQEIIEMES